MKVLVIQAKQKDLGLGNPNETNTKKDDAIMDKGAEDLAQTIGSVKCQKRKIQMPGPYVSSKAE